MPWLQISFSTDARRAASIATALEATDAYAVTLECDASEVLIEGVDPDPSLWSQTRVTGLFGMETRPQQVFSSLARALEPEHLPCYRVARLEDRDWARAWMEHFRPMRFGDRLWVVPSWETAPEPEAVNIVLDPGLAFGVGSHPSTALCLEWLANSEHVRGADVVDYGCGSGILSIAAARLGAAHIWALDNDPQALLVTTENAALNNVAGRITVAQTAPIDVRGVDIIVANILAQTLKSLAPDLAALAHFGTQILLAGILREQVQGCIDAYRAWFELQELKYVEEWALLYGTRRPGSGD